MKRLFMIKAVAAVDSTLGFSDAPISDCLNAPVVV